MPGRDAYLDGLLEKSFLWRLLVLTENLPLAV
jgi:hypothetical protein